MALEVAPELLKANLCELYNLPKGLEKLTEQLGGGVFGWKSKRVKKNYDFMIEVPMCGGHVGIVFEHVGRKSPHIKAKLGVYKMGRVSDQGVQEKVWKMERTASSVFVSMV